MWKIVKILIFEFIFLLNYDEFVKTWRAHSIFREKMGPHWTLDASIPPFLFHVWENCSNKFSVFSRKIFKFMTYQLCWLSLNIVHIFRYFLFPAAIISISIALSPRRRSQHSSAHPGLSGAPHRAAVTFLNSFLENKYGWMGYYYDIPFIFFNIFNF